MNHVVACCVSLTHFFFEEVQMNDVISFHDPTPPWTTLFPDAERVCVSPVKYPPNPGQKSYTQTGRGEGELGISPGGSTVTRVTLFPLSL